MQFTVVKNDVVQYLRNFTGDGFAKGMLVSGLLECAEIIADTARTYAPEDTGLLKSTIGINMQSIESMIVDVEITALSTKGRPYPLFQEYGWTTVSGKRIEGRFYLRWAITLRKQECIDIMNRQIAKALQRRIEGISVFPDAIDVRFIRTEGTQHLGELYDRLNG